MVLHVNLKADDRRTRWTGPVSPLPAFIDPLPRSGFRPDHRLGAIAGSAKLHRADTVSAGEGS